MMTRAQKVVKSRASCHTRNMNEQKATVPQNHDAPKKQFVENHSWLYWVPAVIGLLVGIYVGGYVLNPDKETINKPPIVTPLPTAQIDPNPTVIPSQFLSTTPSPTGMVSCTLDALQCPDGSFVGRTAPYCEFAPCPGNN